MSNHRRPARRFTDEPRGRRWQPRGGRVGSDNINSRPRPKHRPTGRESGGKRLARSASENIAQTAPISDFRYRGFLYALGGEIPKRLGFCCSVVEVQYMLIGAAVDSPVAVGYTHERPPRRGGWTCTSETGYPVTALRVIGSGPSCSPAPGRVLQRGFLRPDRSPRRGPPR